MLHILRLLIQFKNKNSCHHTNFLNVNQFINNNKHQLPRFSKITRYMQA